MVFFNVFVFDFIVGARDLDALVVFGFDLGIFFHFHLENERFTDFKIDFFNLGRIQGLDFFLAHDLRGGAGD